MKVFFLLIFFIFNGVLSKTPAKNKLKNNELREKIALAFEKLTPGKDDMDAFVESFIDNKVTFRKDLYKRYEKISTISFRRNPKQDQGKTTEKRIMWSTRVKINVPATASCSIQPKTVSLIPKVHNSNSIFLPSCTRINRCSGCCGSGITFCKPTKRIKRKFQIYELSFTKKQSMRYNQLVDIFLDEHLECSCNYKNITSKG